MQFLLAAWGFQDDTRLNVYILELLGTNTPIFKRPAVALVGYNLSD